MRRWKVAGLGSLSLLIIGLVWSFDVRAFAPRQFAPTHRGAQGREFGRPELTVTTAAVPLREALRDLPNRGEWEKFVAREGADVTVHVDPRSGRPSSIETHVPLIPGDGAGNQVTLAALQSELGRTFSEVGPGEVGDLVSRYVQRNRSVFGVDPRELGAITVVPVSAEVWQMHARQEVEQVPVRDARLVATVSHGNLVLIGTSMWGDVRTSPRPKIDPGQAIRTGLDYAAPDDARAAVSDVPRLEFLPVTPPGKERAHQSGRKMTGGYDHRLAWIIPFTAGLEASPWEVAVDAHSGEVIYAKTLERDANKAITGSVHGQTVGMPWADTGFTGPKTHTFHSGVYDYVSGTATTTLSGKYIKVTDAGGAISVSGASGDISLTGSSAGNTPAARTTFYEANRIAEIGRSYLPSNTWMAGQLTARTNTGALPCNATWDGTYINFRPPEGCGNPGEIDSIIDHEWGHGLDDNDATGTLTSWTEGYADIAALYRQQQSCLGGGMRTFDNENNDTGCGSAYDENYNANEAQVGSSHCDTNCSGMRDADYAMHADETPDTPANFVCGSCSTQSGGPCGRDNHCASAAVRQAAWDLAARDLQASPYSYDATTAFNIATRLFFLGSQNVGAWHNCDCGAGTSDGCNSDSGYKQWLAVDDNDGNLNNGTPHMAAIYAAFNRHGIACSTPTVQDGGCVDAPSSAPTLTATARCGGVDLSWTSVSNASKYNVYRGEGSNGCNKGKAIIGSPTGTTFQDRMDLNGLQACYVVMAVGSSNSCIAPASTCSCVTPASNLTDTDTPQVTVTYPNGGETLYKTSTPSLLWDASDSCGIASTVALKLSTNGVEGSYSTLFSSQTNAGSKAWTVSGSSSSNAFLKVEATDGASHTGSDTSNAAFTVHNCGPATVSYCIWEEWRCTFNNTCGVSGCANYSCMEDITCTGAEEPPEEACQ